MRAARHAAAVVRCALATVALASGCVGMQVGGRAESIAPRAEILAITGVAIVDPSGRDSIAHDQVIVISNGRILAVGTRSAVHVPSEARVVNGAGKFVIPGLWDSHVHFMNAGIAALAVLLANGVTTVREMGGYIDSTRAWQKRMVAGTLDGPRIVTPGPILESPQYLQGVRDRSERAGSQLAARVLPYRISVGSASEAKAAIDSLMKLRVDFVKIRTVANAPSYYAILREAHIAGLKVAGHPPGVVSSAVAADSGQDDIEHALYLFSQAEREERTRKFLARGTWYTPTLVVSRAAAISGDSANRLIFGAETMRQDPRRAYASPWLIGWWRMQVDERMADTGSATALQSRRGFASSMEEVRQFHAAGVRILAGTDAGSVLVYPGPSLHEELQLLVESGFSPREALWSATAGPAQFARLDGALGRVAVGYEADLVLLDANPLTDIRNTRRIAIVVRSGRVYDRAALDAMLLRVRTENASRD